jgi:hypothetical protein
MKIVVVIPKVHGGTGLYRLRMPHDLIDAEIVYTDSSNYDDLVCDILVCSKMYFVPIAKHIPRLRKEGVVTIIDYDDYWALPQDHMLYHEYKKHDTTKLLTEALRLFEYVTCTTELLANEIRRINPNVTVFENAINPTLEQFQPMPVESDKMRFGWVGGHCHLPDIMLLDGTPQRLKTEFDNYSFNLFGHDQRDGSVYDEFAKILSGNWTATDRLNVFKQAPVDHYTRFYNIIDVCLIPLRGDKFSSMKSELKLVEGAFFKKPCIVSDVMPYHKHLTPKNSLKCTNKTDWYKNIRRIIKNPSLGVDLGLQLYDDLHQKFDLRNVNKRRIEFYHSVCKS